MLLMEIDESSGTIPLLICRRANENQIARFYYCVGDIKVSATLPAEKLFPHAGYGNAFAGCCLR